ncbi:hypothetical protein GCM10023262_15630 [Bartonella pachyuromydis]|uniref:Uncharacterized protein n=1 Tax=Bartonella pachyuromydis TaxID=931097 RepID=A0ABP8VPB4_9HYPH
MYIGLNNVLIDHLSIFKSRKEDHVFLNLAILKWGYRNWIRKCTPENPCDIAVLKNKNL